MKLWLWIFESMIEKAELQLCWWYGTWHKQRYQQKFKSRPQSQIWLSWQDHPPMNAVNSKPNVYANNCKKMQSVSLIQCNLMRFLILKRSQRNCRLSPCTLYKLQWSCRLIHSIAQGIVYLSTCERISSTTIIFQQLPKSHMVEPYNLNWSRIFCFKTCQVHQYISVL